MSGEKMGYTPPDHMSPASRSVEIGPDVTGYSTIKLLAKLTIAVMMKFWAMCTTVLLILLLMYWFYGGWLTLLLLIFALIGLLYNAQDMLLYYPDQPANSRLYVESPSIFGLPYENIFIKTSDGVKLHTVFIKQPEHKLNTAHTVIFFHGNAGNIGHRLVNMYALYSYCGVNILLVEYRGFGKSYGKPSESGIYLDAEAAADYLFKRADIDQSKIIVFGRSLGGAVSIQLSLRPYYAGRISSLIVENTFTSLPEYPSRSCISHIKIPTLFLSGLADDLIPPKMMLDLFQHSGSMLKRLAKFPNGSHNETWQCQGYYETINRFLQEVEEMKRSNITPDSAVTYTVDIPFDDVTGTPIGGGVFAL
ncbi:hypothetical protein LSH36_166g04064 [Paralvinella palmiformis]|uniref:Protein ABHD13 n=1 Tax=Paralvinella palmiformis TaxID=53620 RepID=A0AAD9JTG9_9ANNE|nr:hypothetical protein LSH36_166g04064 [Paralvinella palmiformis]